MKKDRGKFLTIMLVLVSLTPLVGLVGILLPGSGLRAGGITVSNPPDWYPTYSIITVVLGLAFIIGLWMWKKWGVYLAIAYSLISLGAGFAFNQSSHGPTVNLINQVSPLVSYALFYWAVYRKWKYFE